ncbi:hypothetical protein ACJ3XI_00795 [Litorimonas sp. RW-G-Af-16]|uniref:hypothetical protein n=1 Tax=Litorimonas sp. RW-G-Af-16 TaxID=3241168 RepID=UPI00390C498E
MRLVACALSAVLLSGCSWLGNITGNSHQGANKSHQSYKYGAQKYGAQQYGQQAQRGANPCEIPAPNYPIPRGCDPASVTIGTGAPFAQGPAQGHPGGFAQQPQFGAAPQYADANYGSHAGDAYAHAGQRGQRAPKLRKPKWRGQLSLGGEKSNSGNLLDYATVGTMVDTNGNPFDPVAGYNPQTYNGQTQTGVTVDGTLVTTTYTANERNPVGPNSQAAGTGIYTPFGYDEVNRPDISFDDAHSTPAKIALGGEYILNNRTTLFGSVGYAHAEGEHGETASINGTLYRDVSQQSYDAAGAPIGAPVSNVTFLPNQQLASFEYDFTDMRRYDLEVGARQYFNPIYRDGAVKTITPFVGASVGASHVNEVSFDVTQRQTIYDRVMNGETENLTYEVVGPQTTVQLYESQWLPTGQVSAGLDWQVTPKTSLAVETGLRVEGAREYANGEKGDTNITVPFTLRGSYNF